MRGIQRRQRGKFAARDEALRGVRAARHGGGALQPHLPEATQRDRQPAAGVE